MIIPLRTPDGLPDAARLDEWIAECDRCDERRPLGECDFGVWVMGQRNDANVFCPSCVEAIARELIAAVFRAPASYTPAGRQVPVRLLAAIALLCVAALLPRPWRARVECLAGELPRRAGGELR